MKNEQTEARLVRFGSRRPSIARSAFIAPNAIVFGDVTIGSQSSIFYGAVLRGDINTIRVGVGTNIQDNAVVHIADDLGTEIGSWCTIGHSAIVHACVIGDECLIGMGATILDGANIGARTIVGANSLVTQDFKCPYGSLVFGSPARVVRALSAEEMARLKAGAEKYVRVASFHAARLASSGQPMVQERAASK